MSEQHRLALPVGVQIQQYKVESVLGYGGFGIVYKARHIHLGQEFAIKEFLPQEIATREGTTVHPLTTHESGDYDEGMKRFLAEAKQLVQFRDSPSIVSCADFFEANGTAYLVMDFEDGMALSALLAERHKRGKELSEEQLLDIVLPLLDGLDTIHSAGVLHRDIKPGNILVRRSDERPVLIDFGAAKQNFSKHSKSMAPYSPGYAAFEQSGEDGDLGPWTDIYAVGAVMWRMISNKVPVKAENRVRARLRGSEDPMPSAMSIGQGRYSASLLAAIDKCLAVAEEDRFQSVRELRKALAPNAATPAAAPRPSSAQSSTPAAAPAPAAPKAKSPVLAIVLSVIIALGLGFGGLLAAGIVNIDHLTMSREEVASLRGQISKLQAEIEGYKSQLNDGRQQRGSYIAQQYSQAHRDDWQDLVDTAIFSNPAFSAADGDFQMGLILADEQSYKAAIDALTKARDAYANFLKEFNAAEATAEARIDAGKAKADWLALKQRYNLSDPKEVEYAEFAENLALEKRQQGLVLGSGDQWRVAAEYWRGTEKATAAEVAQQRERVAAEEARRQQQRAAEAQRNQRIKDLVGSMVSIPAGSFSMGTNDSESDEYPQHTVRISSFEVGKYEITRGQFRAFIQATNYSPTSVADSKGCMNGESGREEFWEMDTAMHWHNAYVNGLKQSDTHPATCVSYDDAMAYIKWLNEETGQYYRLLSEAEYEYLLRAGSYTTYPFGNDVTVACTYGNVKGSTEFPDGLVFTDNIGCDDKYVFTAPVGRFSANKFGVHDLSGNVREWTRDCWNENYHGAPSDGSAWTGSGECGRATIRGGDWSASPSKLRSAYRDWAGHQRVDSTIGFRIAKD